MRGRVTVAKLAILAVLISLGGVIAQPARASGPASPAGDYIVVLAADADASVTASDHARWYGAGVGHVYRHALRGYSARLSAGAVGRVAADPRVVRVQPDGVVTTLTQALPTGIDRVDAERSPTAGVDGVDAKLDVDVAVIDTGVDVRHPDLNVLRSRGKNCTDERGVDDQNGHGTHVAGIIGARDNDIGVVGVAPGARIWPIKVLDASGSGSISDVICGVDYVTGHASQIEVANMSLGIYGVGDSTCGANNDLLHEAICASVAAGVAYVVAAGNNYGDASETVPATYEEVITVSALADFDGQPGGLGGPTCYFDYDDTRADFSSYGADIDLIAPGLCIRSTWPGGGYNTISGTSMASPHVAGGAALYTVTHPNASPAEVKAALQAAGTTDWNNADAPAGIQEKLLNVAAY